METAARIGRLPGSPGVVLVPSRADGAEALRRRAGAACALIAADCDRELCGVVLCLALSAFGLS